MKTKLLKRLRREAEENVYALRIEMRDMGCGRDVWHIGGFPTRAEAYSREDMLLKVASNRRFYILRRVAEIKRKRK